MKKEIQQFETIMTEFVPTPNHRFGIDYGIVKDAFIFPDEIAKDFQYPGDRETMKGTKCYSLGSLRVDYNKENGFKLGLHFAPRHLRESISENGIVITPEHIGDDPYLNERSASAYFYLSPALKWMTYFGDVMSYNVDYDLWVVDISETLQVRDEAITWGIHYHVGGKCFITPVAIRTLEWHKCKPLGFMEVPDHITKLYAMNDTP